MEPGSSRWVQLQARQLKTPLFLPEVLAVFHEETPFNLSFAFALVNLPSTEMVVFLTILSSFMLLVVGNITLPLHLTIARSLSPLVSQYFFFLKKTIIASFSRGALEDMDSVNALFY